MNGEPLVILLVEDNPDHAELVLRNFKEHHVANRIFHVSDGEEALNYLFRREVYLNPQKSPVPHLILLDLRLPKVDGLEVLRQVKTDEKLKCIPVVVLTTSEAERDLSEAYASYVNSYLVKPVNFDRFRRLMDDLGFYWLAWNCHPCSSKTETECPE